MHLLCIRKYRHEYHWIQTEAVAGIWSIFVFGPIYIVCDYYITHNDTIGIFITLDFTSYQWFLYNLQGFLAFFGIGFIAKAVQIQKVSTVAIILYLEIIFCVLFAALFLNTLIYFNIVGFWIGNVCVLIASLSVIWIRRYNDFNESSNNRRYDDIYSDYTSDIIDEYENEYEPINSDHEGHNNNDTKSLLVNM